MTNWQTKTTKDITTLIKDGTHGTHKDVDEGIPLLSAKDIGGGKVIVTPDSRVISEADFNAIHARYKLKNNDILLTIVGSLGRVAIVSDYKNNYTFQRSVAILRFNDEVNPLYAYHTLTSTVFQKELLKRESKGAQGGVYLGDISKIKIQIPEKPEQERIVGVLEVWDEYIEKLEQKIALKEQLKKGLMQQLLTGKHRLPSFSEKWIVRKMGEFAKESRVKESDNDVHKRLTVRLHLKGVEARGVRGTEAVDSTQYYRRSAGQLIYGKQNIFKGSIGVVPALYDGYASSQDIPSFDIEEAVANVYYIYYYLSRKSIYEWLENFAGGSGSKRLHTSEFYNIKIQLPSLEEQNAIVEVLQLALKEIETLKKHRDVLIKQKKYLLKNLITGTIRTPEDLQPLNTSRLERSAL